MNTNIFEQAINRYNDLKVIVDNLDVELECYNFGNKLNPLIYKAEFDEIKKMDNEENLYLNDLLIKYRRLLKHFKYVISEEEGEPPFLEGRPFKVKGFISAIKNCLFQIVDHLKDLLKPDSEVKGIPQKFEKLGPIEKLLIVYYLNLNQKLFNNPIGQLNSTHGKYFLSRLFDINPESIRNPVDKIMDYTVNIIKKPQQALNLYPTLEKVKQFFDKSELNKISAEIEVRINELKRISGKD